MFGNHTLNCLYKYRLATDSIQSDFSFSLAKSSSSELDSSLLDFELSVVGSRGRKFFGKVFKAVVRYRYHFSLRGMSNFLICVQIKCSFRAIRGRRGREGRPGLLVWGRYLFIIINCGYGSLLSCVALHMTYETGFINYYFIWHGYIDERICKKFKGWVSGSCIARSGGHFTGRLASFKILQIICNP